MSPRQRLATFLLLLFVTTGCVNTNTVQQHTLPVVRRDKALVYFYREGQLEGSGSAMQLYENGTRLGYIKNASFFSIYATPGPHDYEVRASLAGTLERRVVFEAGKTYYLRADPNVGLLSGSVRLSVTDEQEGAPALKHLRMRDPLTGERI